ncbi:hypothetical protein RUM43_001604 [Polyplax serrata]|uniref:Small ribosomal subunit protein uS12m n=1 Tax=Polyplax serrata TaxID=468196 RepID=A0AAN8SE47_POLSC
MNFIFNIFKSVSPAPLAKVSQMTDLLHSYMPKRFNNSLQRMHRLNMKFLENPVVPKKKSPLDGKPFAKGIILRTLIKKPRKPNSANRKCVLVRLSTGKELTAYVPGEGHNLQEHQVVLCRVGRLKDVPGVKIKCVRGKFDLPHVIKESKS